MFIPLAIIEVKGAGYKIAFILCRPVLAMFHDDHPGVILIYARLMIRMTSRFIRPTGRSVDYGLWLPICSSLAFELRNVGIRM